MDFLKLGFWDDDPLNLWASRKKKTLEKKSSKKHLEKKNGKVNLSKFATKLANISELGVAHFISQTT